LYKSHYLSSSLYTLTCITFTTLLSSFSSSSILLSSFSFFFFNDTATTEIYTLSLHDALPICSMYGDFVYDVAWLAFWWPWYPEGDRKSTRLNSSHSQISYAVFCLKKKKILKMDTLEIKKEWK